MARAPPPRSHRRPSLPASNHCQGHPSVRGSDRPPATQQPHTRPVHRVSERCRAREGRRCWAGAARAARCLSLDPPPHRPPPAPPPPPRAHSSCATEGSFRPPTGERAPPVSPLQPGSHPWPCPDCSIVPTCTPPTYCTDDSPIERRNLAAPPTNPAADRAVCLSGGGPVGARRGETAPAPPDIRWAPRAERRGRCERAGGGRPAGPLERGGPYFGGWQRRRRCAPHRVQGWTGGQARGGGVRVAADRAGGGVAARVRPPSSPPPLFTPAPRAGRLCALRVGERSVGTPHPPDGVSGGRGGASRWRTRVAVDGPGRGKGARVWGARQPSFGRGTWRSCTVVSTGGW